MQNLNKLMKFTEEADINRYFTHHGISFIYDPLLPQPPVLQVVDNMDKEQQVKLEEVSERINKMTDELGQDALFGVVTDKATFNALENAYIRSLWCFLNEPLSFKHAENARFSEYYREGRNWSGFQVTEDLTVKDDDTSINQFIEQYQQRIQVSTNMSIEIFHRTRTQLLAKDNALIQVTVYREERPTADLSFNDHKLVNKIRYPVIEQTLTYEPSVGVIEVVASKREQRQKLAKLFTECLLKQTVDTAKIPLRYYDLSILLRPFDFPTDSNDRIASVKLMMIKIQTGQNKTAVTLELDANDPRTIQELADDLFKKETPLKHGNKIVQAKIKILFEQGINGSRKKVLPLSITMPNGCNLKGQTQREQLIGQKYLQRWHLLGEVE
jgi:hypothetical protein